MTLLLLLTLAQTFLAEPYLQLGQQPAPGRLTIVWQTPDNNGNWWLEHERDGKWRPAARVHNRRVQLGQAKAFRIFEAELDELAPGAEFAYRVTRNDQAVFNGRGKAIAPADGTVTFAVVGDTGQGTRGQREVADRMLQVKPDALLVAGDIVYPNGRLKYYAERWFPYMKELIAQRVSVGAAGNHDTEECLDLAGKPDSLAYFYVWSAPLNGPAGMTIPAVGPTAELERASGGRYPRMANYSFDYGPVHWVVIDSNSYVDWTRPDLQQWLEQDLGSTQQPWKLVLLHHAPFHSTGKHAEQQRLRVLAPLFERLKVNAVLAGHVHNYERSHAIRFQPENAAHPLGSRQRIRGKVERDEKSGVTYIVTGAGGAGLHDGRFTGKPERWQEFTAKFEARDHSFTLLEASAGRLMVRQIASDGRELDSFELARK